MEHRKKHYKPKLDMETLLKKAKEKMHSNINVIIMRVNRFDVGDKKKYLVGGFNEWLLLNKKLELIKNIKYELVFADDKIVDITGCNNCDIKKCYVHERHPVMYVCIEKIE